MDQSRILIFANGTVAILWYKEQKEEIWSENESQDIYKVGTTNKKQRWTQRFMIYMMTIHNLLDDICIRGFFAVNNDIAKYVNISRYKTDTCMFTCF